jgi:hypothetical protein
MKVVIGSPRMGKTEGLIHQSSLTGFYIVTHSIAEVQRVARRAKELDLKIPFPLTFEELLNHEYYGKGVKGVLLDNVDLLLKRICRGVAVDTIVVGLDYL